MPRVNDSLRNIANKLLGPNSQIRDNRGNPVSLPSERISQQIQEGLRSSRGISRTLLPKVNRETWYDFSGEDGLSILLSVTSPDGTNNKPGFTPPEAYYILGSDVIDNNTGFPKEAGVVLRPASFVSNSGVDKISRTNLIMNLASSQANSSNVSSDGNSVQLFFTRESVKGKQNVWGDSNLNLKPTASGWTNPLHYITNPDNKNDKTGLPKELGDFPYNYNDKFGASYFHPQGPGIGVKNLLLTTPKNKVDGPKNDGINSKLEVAEVFRNAKSEEIRQGGYEQYDFLHNLDRLEALDSPDIIPSDVYLATFVETKDHEDPVMFGYDLLINFDTSPLFNGALLEFINRYSSLSEEIDSRKEVYQNFVNQFKRFFKIQSSTSAVDTGVAADDKLIVPVKNDTQRDREVYKTYYLKEMSGLDLLTHGSVTNTSETVKSMVDYGKDMIKIKLYEDLTLNTGYLATLYKLLTWSRINGKQLIPENLLRFDCKIVINEVRNYNKVIKNNGVMEAYADDMNTYIYTLYDCQFMFDKLSHDDSIDMWSIKTKEEFDIAFNYKYTTMKFMKYDPNKPSSIRRWTFDNKLHSPIEYSEDVNAPSLKYYERIAKVPPPTSEIVDAQLRNIRRQLNEAAVAADVNLRLETTVQENAREINRRVREGGPSIEEAPAEYFENASSLADVKLLEKYFSTNVRGPYDKFEQSEESTLDRFKRQQKNADLETSLRSRIVKADTGSYNKQRALISRSVERIIDGREQISIGA